MGTLSLFCLEDLKALDKNMARLLNISYSYFQLTTLDKAVSIIKMFLIYLPSKMYVRKLASILRKWYLEFWIFY